MRHAAPRRVRIRLTAALGVCLASLGCAVSGNPGLTHQVASLPASVREQTHLVFVESPIDVPRIGRLASTAGLFQELGFENVNVAGYNGCELAERIRHVAHQHPGARVMVVGWSAGSLDVVDAALELEGEGIRIDTVVFLDSAFVKLRLRESTPQNVGHYALIYRVGHEPPLEVPNSQIYEVPTLNHLAIPTLDETVDILLTEVLAMSQTARAPLQPAPGIAETTGAAEPEMPGYAEVED